MIQVSLSAHLRLRLVVAVLFCATFGAAGDLVLDQPVGAGRVCTFSLDEQPQKMELFVPVNYRAETQWPILFLYPELGEEPSTLRFQRYTARRDWLIVALTYGPLPTEEQNTEQLTQTAQVETARFEAIRKALAGKVTIHPDQVYLGGIGKGGWLAGLVGEHARDLAGTCIQLAGRALDSRPEPFPGRLTGRTAYLGVGEFDPDNMAAHMAAGFYKMRGVTVTVEDYPGLGHQAPSDVPPLLDAWLKSRVYLMQADDAARQELKTWYTNATKDAMAHENPLIRYCALEAVLEDPRLQLCGDTATRLVERAMGSIRNVPDVRKYWQAGRDYLRLIRQELDAKTITDLRVVLDGWKQLESTLGGTPAAQRAPLEIARLQQRIVNIELPPTP